MEPDDQIFGTDQAVTDTANTENTSSENPAWQELYGVLPDSLHSVARPVLEKWEQNNSAKIQQYAETQKAYEPYKEFLDNGIPAEQLAQAYEVMNLINTDPQGFLAQMQAFYGGDTTQPQQQQQPEQQNPGDNDYSGFDEQPFDFANTPEYKKLQEQQDVIAGFLASEVEKQQQAAQDAQLEADLSALKEKYGEYDEQYVVGLAVNGVPLEDGVKRYQSMVEKIRNTPAAQDNLPSIMSPGGGVPSEQVNPADMSAEQRKALVMNILAQANNG